MTRRRCGSVDSVSSNRPLLEAGRNCWRIEPTGRAALIVDACDYFRLAMDAMRSARSQILIVGWDLDTRIRLTSDEEAAGAPAKLGPFLSWLAKRNPELQIRILVWDHAMLSVLGRGTTLLRMLRWKAHRQISVKWDSVHPLEGSHHQKILVVDDAVAFCGGIDMTGDRWDTRRHLDKDSRRRRPFTKRRYGPWHDASMAVDRRAAIALGDLARARWKAATGEELTPPNAAGHDPWPQRLEPAFRDLNIAIARTRPAGEDFEEIREIEASFVDLIRAARRSVYVETQYFASRAIAEAIAERLGEDDGPEFVVINPRTGEGWLDDSVMSPARYELFRALKDKDRHGRFRIYTPVTEGAEDIYVHAKVMIVDEEVLRVGSANMNNRSMGLDSECDLIVEAEGDREAGKTIARLRADLLAEHLGREREEVERCLAEKGSLIACIEALRGSGRSLRPLEPEEPSDIAKAAAKSEALDPESTGDGFEPARPGLLRRLRRR